MAKVKTHCHGCYKQGNRFLQHISLPVFLIFFGMLGCNRGHDKTDSPAVPVMEKELSLDQKWQVDFIAEKLNTFDVGIIRTKDGRELPAWKGTDGKTDWLVYKSETVWRDNRNGKPATVFLVVPRSALDPQKSKDIIHIKSGQLQSRAQLKANVDWQRALEAVKDNGEDANGWRKLVLGDFVQSVAIVKERIICFSDGNRVTTISVERDGVLMKRKK